MIFTNHILIEFQIEKLSTINNLSPLKYDIKKYFYRKYFGFEQMSHIKETFTFT